MWDDLRQHLCHEDNHQRAIAAQVLCNLAKSDAENRMLKDFNALLAVAKDERLVTARHCLQSIRKIGAAGKKHQKMVVDGFAGRFRDCVTEKNCTLICFDIIQGLRKLYEVVKDEKIREKAMELIETEDDDTVWKVR